MPIVVEAGPNVQEYHELELEQHVSCPGSCLNCGAVGQMIGHGYYLRKPKDVEKGWVIRVKRWKCKACGKTVGAVPSFLLFFRHYLLRVIQDVVVGRFELGYSWTEMDWRYRSQGTPAMRTMQHWCVRLAEQAPSWLGMMEKTLAEHVSRSVWLDPQGEALQIGQAAQALLRSSLHFLAWAKGRWREVVGYGLNDRLRFLWYWGNRRAGFSRLA